MERKRQIKKFVDGLIKKYGTSDICLEWEGGNDEGSYTLMIGGEDVNVYNKPNESDEYQLLDALAAELGYWGFAGDYSVNGSISYDENTECFVGEDSMEDNAEKELLLSDPIKLKIPNQLWFDSISLNVSGHAECMDVSFKFFIENGPVCSEHVELEKKFTDFVGDSIFNALKEESGSCVGEINSVYVDKEVTKDDMEQDEDGNYVFSIEGVIYYEYQVQDNTYSISIQ